MDGEDDESCQTTFEQPWQMCNAKMTVSCKIPLIFFKYVVNAEEYLY
jgi:hypothetical protein